MYFKVYRYFMNKIPLVIIFVIMSGVILSMYIIPAIEFESQAKRFDSDIVNQIAKKIAENNLRRWRKTIKNEGLATRCSLRVNYSV